ncbi:MAG: LacI family transcriptional regulator [Treponema sp.]|jgi:LacI family transcriptional regulator|nr:LacI family transcriptional regulator [Treponema sp.]
MAARIIDIAKAARVSPSAVSLALNNKPGISAEVRQKIIAIAVDMGYKTAVNLQSDTNESITVKLLKIATHGHIVNERHNAFITEYMEGIEAAAKKRGYKLEVSFFNRVPVEEIIDAHRETIVDGLIILGTELNAHEVDFFTVLTKPVVFIDTYFPFSVYDCIDMDNMDGVFKAIQHLYKNGHRNIGLVKGGLATRNFTMREFGFREAMDYFSLPVQEKFIITVDPAYDRAIVDMNKYLKKNSAQPSAFFCMNDTIAYACMKALKEHNYRIPEDVSIVGFDDLPSSSLPDPPLTTIRVANHQIGERALEKVVERISSFKESAPENILVAGKLVVRDSVKKI